MLTGSGLERLRVSPPQTRHETLSSLKCRPRPRVSTIRAGRTWARSPLSASQTRRANLNKCPVAVAASHAGSDNDGMGHVYWPLFDLRLRIGELILKPLTECDLEPLVEALSDDVELNPDAAMYDGQSTALARGTDHPSAVLARDGHVECARLAAELRGVARRTADRRPRAGGPRLPAAPNRRHRVVPRQPRTRQRSWQGDADGGPGVGVRPSGGGVRRSRRHGRTTSHRSA